MCECFVWVCARVHQQSTKSILSSFHLCFCRVCAQLVNFSSNFKQNTTHTISICFVKRACESAKDCLHLFSIFLLHFKQNFHFGKTENHRLPRCRSLTFVWTILWSTPFFRSLRSSKINFLLTTGDGNHSHFSIEWLSTEPSTTHTQTVKLETEENEKTTLSQTKIIISLVLVVSFSLFLVLNCFLFFFSMASVDIWCATMRNGIQSEMLTLPSFFVSNGQTVFHLLPFVSFILCDER